MNANFSRRNFLQATALGAAAVSMSARSYGRIINANERIRLAQIGCGGRGLGAHWLASTNTTRPRTSSMPPCPIPGASRANKLPRTARSGTVMT